MKLTKEEQDKLNEQLYDAVNNNDLASVKAAVAAGADVNARNDDGNTPLIRSVICSVGINIMQFLLEHGANPNLQNDYGDTALHRYFATADTPKAKLLLDHNANMYIKNKDGRTPFAEAFYYNGDSIAELYVLNGYTPTKEDFTAITNNDKKIEVKTRLMELAQQVQNHKAKLDEANQVPYCDEELMEF